MTEARPTGGQPAIANPNRALAFIVITVVLDVIGIGIILPVLPELLLELQPGSLAEAAVYGGWLAFAYAFMQFLFSPILGNLSDAYGRRPILILGLVVLAFDYVIMALAPTIFILFIGRVLAGAAGASFTTASAYIADVSPPEKRAANFGLIGAAFGVGFVIGPAIGGILGEYGTRLPFWAAAGFTLLNAAFGFFVLPESLPPSRRRKFDIWRSNPFGAFKQFLGRPIVLLLIGAALIFELSQQVYPSIWPYWGAEVYGWGPGTVGLSLAAFGVAIFVAEGFVLRWLLSKVSEHAVIIGSTVLAVIVCFILGFNRLEWVVWLLLVPCAFSGFANSALHGLASNRVGEDSQGELSGAITSGVAVVSFVAPPVMTGVFAQFSQRSNDLAYIPGAPFLLAGVIAGFMFIAYGLARRKMSAEKPDV
jgi:DHA1 family tetracycline resistance protein-like MFS transporter